MKRRSNTPAVQVIAPFVDQFGRPTYQNPYGHYRANPALNVTAPLAAIAPVLATIATEAPEVVAENTAAVIPAVQQPRLRLSLHTTSAIAPATIDTALGGFDATSPAYLAAHAHYRNVMGLDTPEVPTEHVGGNRHERRARIHRRVRRSAAVVTAVGAGLVGISAASAYLNSTGSGTGSASTGTLQAVASSGAVVSNLIPDSSAHDVTLTVTNPNSYAVTLSSVTGNGPVVAANGCSPTGVTFTDQTGLSESIPGGSVPTTVTLTDAATMDDTSASACQGTTFTIPVTISVQK